MPSNDTATGVRRRHFSPIASGSTHLDYTADARPAQNARGAPEYYPTLAAHRGVFDKDFGCPVASDGLYSEA